MDQEATNRITGAVDGAVVQARTVYGGIHVHAATSSEEGAVAPATPPPSGWADVSALPDEVRSLLQAQVEAAKDLPYRLPGARRPSLDTVYVRQDLGSGVDELPSEQHRPMPILDSRGQLVDAPGGPVVRVAVRPPARTVREALDDSDYLLVTGGPGQGKSTLSLRLAAMVAEQWLCGEPDPETAPLAEPVVPLRLPARELATWLDLPFPEALARSAAAEYNRLLVTQPTTRTVQDRVAGCRWLLLVDGLDEIAGGADRDRLVSTLTGWAAQDGSPYRFVLTTRPIEGAALAPLQRTGAARYELQPFDEKALRRFADHWFGDTDRGYRFVRQVRAAHLDELVRVPLLATIAAIIFEQRGTRPLPDNQFELYEAYLRYLRTAHEVATGPFDQLCDPLLEHLGRVRVELDTSLMTAACEWVEQRSLDLTGDWQQGLVEYLTAVGPLTRRGGDLRFLHHSFAEHLAATAEARLLPERFEPEAPSFARLLHAARPNERGQHARAVLLHYTRLHRAEADRLVAWLHGAGGEQHLLAARLLAAHTPAGVEVVSAFLATVREWAMTTQYLGGDILEQVSRAVHHPGMATWLTDLMHDEKAPWSSRIQAAAALSTRLRGPGSVESTALLRTAVGEMSVPVRHRLAAAEALSECGIYEREAAERGLRSVLADPDATGWNCRTAAVVLAGLGDEARGHAVQMLTAMLDDTWLPDYDLADVAAGLVELGVELHDRCADVFRAILDRCRNGSPALRDAAIGLASLGPHHLNEAAGILTLMVIDRRLPRYFRLGITKVLAELGPEARLTAAQHVADMANEFDIEPHEVWNIAQHLADFGLHDHALRLLRDALSGPGLNPNHRLWAARGLAAIGPDQRDEAAREFRRVADHPCSRKHTRATALAELAALGAPHREPAVASLRGMLADRGAEAALRCEVATKLVRLGPEFHGEVVEHVLAIASRHTEPDVRAMAWHLLRDVNPGMRHRALAELRNLVRPEAMTVWDAHRSQWMSGHYSDTDDPQLTAAVFMAVLGDSTVTDRLRVEACEALIGLGRRFHPTAFDGVVALLRSQSAHINSVVNGISWRVGAAPRAELIELLRGTARQPFTSPAVLGKLATALRELNHWSDKEIVAALRVIVDDGMVDLDERADAAVELARAAPEELPDVIGLVLRSHNAGAYWWDRRLKALVTLGADIVPDLRKLVTSRDLRSPYRVAAAATLARLCPEARKDALAELRAQSDDDFLVFTWRSDAMLQLAQCDASARTGIVVRYGSILDDERRRLWERSEAASQLIELDEPRAEAAMAALHRLATGTRSVAADRWSAFNRFASHRGLGGEANEMGLAMTREPTATTDVRGNLRVWLSGKARLEAERSLLADRTADPGQRVSGLSTWDHRALGEQAEAVLHDVLSAADSTPAERVEAAAALGELAPRHIPEAVRILNELTNGQAGTTARLKLAGLSLAERHRILADAECVVADETRPRRDRRQAATLICDLASTPAEQAVEYLRQLSHKPHTTGAEQAQVRYALRHTDGLDPLRAIRDDNSTSPAVRWKVASQLQHYDTTDRSAGARTLDSLARDTTCRPTLRWRAANDLTNFGDRGREMGTATLRTIGLDEMLPIPVRIDAARALGVERPDLRAEIVQLLQRLSTAPEHPRTRLRALQALGRFDPTESALALSEMAADGALAAGIRLRAAIAMARLHREYRDRAAVTVKDIAYDDDVPWHIRMKAARRLARWSEPCRAEALELFENGERAPGRHAGSGRNSL